MFRLTGGHQGNTLKTHRRQCHDMYRHASLGSGSFCVNKERVRIGELLLQWECGISVWKGLFNALWDLSREGGKSSVLYDNLSMMECELLPWGPYLPKENKTN